MLVLFLYASKSGLPAYFFSKSGTPETKRMRVVMVSGPMMTGSDPEREREKRKIPHHWVTSPK